MNSGLDIALPKSWTWSPLKFATTFLNRGTAPVYVDVGPVRAISQAANQLTGLDWARTRFHDHNGDPKRLKGYLLPGDVLINSTGTGTLGRVGYFTKGPDSLPCVADGHVTVARAYQQLADSRYLYHWLSCRPFYDYIYSALIVGATNQIELNRERLAEAPIALPPLDEQRRIADFLDIETERLDRVRRCRLVQVQLLTERFRRSIELLFDRQDSANCRIKDRLLSRPRYGVLVPEFVDDGVPFVRVNDLIDLSDKIADLRRIPDSLSQQYSTTVVRQRDVLVSVVGTLGRSVVAPPDLVGANVNRAIAVLRVQPGVSPDLLSAWMGTSMFETQSLLATASDSAQRTLGMEDLANFAISWPADGEAQGRASVALAAIQAEFSNLRAALDRQLALTHERSQALITAAVTGQIDVATARGVDV